MAGRTSKIFGNPVIIALFALAGWWLLTYLSSYLAGRLAGGDYAFGVLIMMYHILPFAGITAWVIALVRKRSWTRRNLPLVALFTIILAVFAVWIVRIF